MDAVEWAVKRQVLGGIIGDITSGVLGGGDDTATSTADGGGGIIPTLSVSSDTSTSTTESSTSSSSATSSEPTSSSATSTSSSSTSSTPTSSSTFESSSSTSSTPSTSSSVPASSSSPTSSAASSSVTPPPVTTITATDSGGSSVTSVITASSSADPSSTSGVSDGDASSVSGAQAFLDNKVLSGVVFGIAGLVALIGLIFLTTWYIRRTREKDLLNEAVNFTPQSHGYGGDEMTRGLTEASNRNSTSSGSLHGAMSGYRPDVPPVPAYQQQQPYYGATGGGETYPTYAAPSQIANAMNTYENPGMVDVGGGGITRKYSNVSRVPVPNPPHDGYGGYR